MIRYIQASTINHLEQILLLQQHNLPKNLTDEEKECEGFLTVEHSLEILKEMNDECGHIVALENEKVIGYALCMLPKFAESIEVLKPMFHEINKVVKGKDNYMVMGQICVAKSHRGHGIFRQLYKTMKEKLPYGFDTIITEVDAKNRRSMNAHLTVGFTELKKYCSDGKDWVLIILK
ncbi:GNAT family N-acetyltransferase [Flagellimonas pacifica]|uniref:L-amino acid N-acyltransferase YncA n=1 Tax=Flagellimonas pacifica TaxID=1247520 RepID=A0A285MBY9_9FLAO|nr:GNAT family N-acetyltransferase [Allomuricauda parva]SNY94702.1 L-amino acid N-acyltransferase YncA [Allomuricauda parva]